MRLIFIRTALNYYRGEKPSADIEDIDIKFENVNLDEFWDEIELGIKLTSVDGLMSCEMEEIMHIAEFILFADEMEWDCSHMDDDSIILSNEITSVEINNFSKSTPVTIGGVEFHHLRTTDSSRDSLPVIVVMEHSQGVNILEDASEQKEELSSVK